MKRMAALILTLLLYTTAAQASILPPTGVDEDFAAWTGIECTPAVILCENLSVYDARGDQGGEKVNSLNYTGRDIPVIESWDGYALIYYSDGTKTGWVHSEYLLFDPAWYVCDQGMPVYAYPDTTAPRVGYLATGTKLPIITEYEGDAVNGWVCVSLRGAAGWIRKTAADTVYSTWFRPEQLAEVDEAMLTYQGEAIYASRPGNADLMEGLSVLLTNAEDLGGPVAGCPFGATLRLTLSDGRVVTLELATDSCCVYRVDGRDYQYARHLCDPCEGSPDSTVLLNIFGLESWEELLLPGNG